jgi:hypothetical protein
MNDSLLGGIEHVSLVGRLMDFLTWAEIRDPEHGLPERTESEFKLIEIARKTNSLMAVFYRLNKILAFFSFDDLPLKTPLFNITRADWLEYHRETFIFLTISFQDRALKLTNEALQLGLSAIQCKHDRILKKINNSYPQVSQALVTIDNCVSQYRETRNSIIHEGHGTDFGDYSRFQAVSQIERWGVTNIDCDSFDYLSEFVRIRNELVEVVHNFGNQAINASEILLDALEPPVGELIRVMRQEHGLDG